MNLGGNNNRVIDQRCFLKGELSCPEFPVKVRKLKGIEFNPEVILNRKTLYFIVVTNRFNFIPAVGFYDVPNKGFITWIGGSKLISKSNELVVGPVTNIGYIFEMFEDTPPIGIVPYRGGINKKGLPPGIIY